MSPFLTLLPKTLPPSLTHIAPLPAFFSFITRLYTTFACLIWLLPVSLPSLDRKLQEGRKLVVSFLYPQGLAHCLACSRHSAKHPMKSTLTVKETEDTKKCFGTTKKRVTAPSWKGGAYFSKVVREGICEEVPQAGHAPSRPTQCHHLPHRRAHHTVSLFSGLGAPGGQQPFSVLSGSPAPPERRSAYSHTAITLKNGWMSERSWENLLRGRGIVTGPEVGKLSSKEPGRKPSRPGGEQGPWSLRVWSVQYPTLPTTPGLTGRQSGEERPCSLDNPWL